jgi:alpha-galactosidase
VLPELVQKRSKFDLTPERRKIFDKWIQIYKSKMLSRGEYRGDLYDIGFDLPEAHAIRKGDTMYYAFFARHWSGLVELRGLRDRAYRLMDYVNHRDLGTVRGPTVKIPATFNQHLLIEAQPE